MPTKREREYYRLGFIDGTKMQSSEALLFDAQTEISDQPEVYGWKQGQSFSLLPKKKKRKLSAWNKFVKANSKKPRFRYARSNKINLKKMAVAFRKKKRR
jgi:hypothetical protein